MRRSAHLAWALLIAAPLAGGTAFANTCQVEDSKMTCPTGMPIGGYCECTAHGATQGGTVVSSAAPHHPQKATRANCATQPDAPGCH